VQTASRYRFRRTQAGRNDNFSFSVRARSILTEINFAGTYPHTMPFVYHQE
jgi:hypothetical protein